MPLISITDMLQHARHNEYAVAVFEVGSPEVVKGVLQAAEQIRAPVVLGINTAATNGDDPSLLLPVIEQAAQEASIPVAVQAQKVSDYESLIAAINGGCNAVMLDCRTRHDMENLQLCRDLTVTAHRCGVPAEVVLTAKSDMSVLEDYVDVIGMDFLRVVPVTVYGRREQDMLPDYLKLHEVNRRVHLPLSIQADAGISKEQCRQMIDDGIALINFGAVLNEARAAQIHRNVLQAEGRGRGLMCDVVEAVKTKAITCLELSNSAGRSAAILAVCEAWLPVEHLIIYNVRGIDAAQADHMMAEGRKNLSQIPGVRQVVTGRAVKADAKYQYTWLIRFCHRTVIDSYRDNPAHVAFADNLFRPVAGDRVSIDFEWVTDDPCQNMAIALPENEELISSVEEH
ncbi:MAG: class II fructose-bisphosphate aldolase [Gammaproteobacteria bacterium]|nr:class II fructose-bisphosphate aldolase [Gammaproteobacteria bacterium]MDH5653011.1 class II fructose-bisphosphate aldolase [Gammaproteobacteria bacterium]